MTVRQIEKKNNFFHSITYPQNSLELTNVARITLALHSFSTILCMPPVSAPLVEGKPFSATQSPWRWHFGSSTGHFGTSTGHFGTSVGHIGTSTRQFST